VPLILELVIQYAEREHLLGKHSGNIHNLIWFKCSINSDQLPKVIISGAGVAIIQGRGCKATMSRIIILSGQVLQVSVSGRNLSKASYFLRVCGNSLVKVANS
jgi:hypothetical protein